MKKSFSLAHSTSARLLIDSLRIASMGKKMLQREKGKMQTDSAVLYIWSAITELRWSIICLLAAFVLARRQQNWLDHGCAFVFSLKFLLDWLDEFAVFYFPRTSLFNSAAQLTYRPVTAALSDRRTYPIRRYTRLIGCQGRALLLGRSRAATGSSLRGLIFRTASICI